MTLINNFKILNSISVMQLTEMKNLTADVIDFGFEIKGLFWEPATVDVIDINIDLQILFYQRQSEVLGSPPALRNRTIEPNEQV